MSAPVNIYEYASAENPISYTRTCYQHEYEDENAFASTFTIAAPGLGTPREVDFQAFCVQTKCIRGEAMKQKHAFSV